MIEKMEELVAYDEKREQPVNPLIQLYLDRKPLIKLDKQIVDDLVDNIVIHNPNRIEIFWKFRDIVKQ